MPFTAPTDRLANRLRFRHLQLVIELHDRGSLRAAAEVLNVTQPALSKALGEIESAFGFLLFSRSPRGLVATDQGEVVARGARRLLGDLLHVRDDAVAIAATTALRIGAPPFVAQGYVPSLVQRLRKREPRLRIEVQEERVPALLERLLEGELDALVSTLPAELPPHSDVLLRHDRLFDAEFAIIASARHPLADARRVSWAQLAAVDWVMPTRTSMVWRMLAEMFRRAGLSTPVAAVESTSPYTNMRMVAIGFGVGAVPIDVARPAERAGQIRRLRVHPAIDANPVALVYRSGPRSERLETLRSVLGV